MKKLLVIIAVAMVAGAAWAQTVEPTKSVAQTLEPAGDVALKQGTKGNVALKQGMKEVALSGNFDPDAFDEYNFSLKPAFGVFVIDNVEVGVRGLWEGSKHVDIMGIQGFAEYNLDLESPLVPFVRVAAGWLGGELDVDGGEDQSNDTASAAGAVGVKYFITDMVALGLDVEYTKATDDIFVSDDDEELQDDNVEVNLALRVFLP